MADAPTIALRPEERRIVDRILARHVPDAAVWVFGSRATGRTKRWSDLDLAISGDAPIDAALLAELREDFAESDLPWKVDLLDWAATGAEFRAIVAPELVVLRSGART